MKQLFTTLLFLVSFLSGFSQEYTPAIQLSPQDTIPTEYNFCATEYDPTALEPYQVNFQPPVNRTLGWKTIPTVIHIVYHDSVPNSWFSEDYVNEAMADVNIEFAEASIEFDLQAINYKNLADYEWAEAALEGQVCFPTYGTQNTILADDIQWDREQYCNIYIIPNMCNYVLGWSYVTNYVHNKRDGVWVTHRAFGLGDWLPSRNNLNRVLTHELGHYCGLHHVFNGTYDCLEDATLHDEEWYQYGDLVADTPPIEPSWYCDQRACSWVYYPDFPPLWNSQRPWANYEHNNHMDYYADSCRQAFTPGQIERMHTMLEFQRASLFGGEPFCFGDLTGDGVVGVSDLLVVVSYYGEHNLEGDLDNNGIVGATDLTLLLQFYDTNCNDPDALFYEPPSPALEKHDVRSLLKELENIR